MALARLGLGDCVQILDTHSVYVPTNMPLPSSHSTIDYLYLEPGIVAMGSIGPLLLGADANVFLLASGPQQFEEAGWTPSSEA